VTWPEKLVNPLQFFLGILVYSVVVLNWLHEFFHLAITHIFGGQGHVVVSALVFATDITTWPPELWQEALVVYGGGWMVAGVCALSWWLFQESNEARIIFYAVGWSQFTYGAVEGTLWMINRYDLIGPMGTVAFILGMVIALATGKELWRTNGE